MKKILAIDPGTTESGVCLIEAGTCLPWFHEKMENHEVFGLIESLGVSSLDTEVAVEMVASYGMPVGAEVFDTVVWIGRYVQFFRERGYKVSYVYRKDEKMAICFDPRANDATIRQALVDRFARGVQNHGKGTKAAPGWFYGFKADEWAAYAVAVTYNDREVRI